MDISKFFAKKSDLSHQSNSEVDNKRNHALANLKRNKNKSRPIVINFLRDNLKRKIF